eukprot:2896397-Amphidinium_carterae.5
MSLASHVTQSHAAASVRAAGILVHLRTENSIQLRNAQDICRFAKSSARVSNRSNLSSTASIVSCRLGVNDNSSSPARIMVAS